MRRKPWLSLVFFVALMAFFLQGCGKKPETPPQDKADVAVEKFLNAWIHGGAPDSWGTAGQPIQGTDPDWKANYRLLSFLIAETKPSEEKPDHVRCRVSLSLKNPRGTNVEKEVVYDVVLGETIVITRERGK